MKTGIILGILAILLVGGLLIVQSLRPHQEQITEEILEAKNTDPYYSFIADNLVGGGPPKDGIPAIDKPKYLTAEEARLDNDQVIFGVDYGGKILALPQDIMYWHEIVNEKTDSDKMISITYCPLTGSVIGYRDVNLGVSGSLYNSNLVVYDRATDSIYPQILGTAVTGSDTGRDLDTFPVTVTTWGQWKSAYPATLTLSRDTGYERDYDDPPYKGYDSALSVWFPVAAQSSEYPSKKLVVGIEYEGKAYTALKEQITELGSFKYDTGDGVIILMHDPSLNIIRVTDSEGNHVTHFEVYWFAWYAYHPNMIIIKA